MSPIWVLRRSMGVLTRLIFEITLIPSWRPGTLYDLEVTRFILNKHRCVDVHKKTNRILTPNGSTTAQGDLISGHDEPMTVNIWRETQIDGRFCVSADISEYLQMIEKHHRYRQNFFLP